MHRDARDVGSESAAKRTLSSTSSASKSAQATNHPLHRRRMRVCEHVFKPNFRELLTPHIEVAGAREIQPCVLPASLVEDALLPSRFSTKIRRALVSARALRPLEPTGAAKRWCTNFPVPAHRLRASDGLERFGTRGRIQGSGTEVHHPTGAVSSSTCPTMVFYPFGCAGSGARTSATILRGTVATGKTRPWAPSNAATQSNPATRFPVSLQCGIGRFRWRAPPSRRFHRSDAASPVTTFAPGVITAERGEGHAQVPGGGNRVHRGSVHFEPPSSATLTIAVTSSVRRRSALSEEDSPCPPPSATTAGP